MHRLMTSLIVPAVFAATAAGGPPAGDPAGGDALQRHQGEAPTASIDVVYRRWLEGYMARGGDHAVRVGLGALSGVCAPTAASGMLRADLHTGEITITVEGDARELEVWLVDNHLVTGGSFLPDIGDGLHMVGVMHGNGPGPKRLRARLGRAFFDRFQLDLVVVSPRGAGPFHDPVLLGSRSAFARRYTFERTGTGDPAPVPVAAADPRVALGLVSREVLRGADLFFRGTFSGNGRTCGSCHPADNNLTIGPESIGNLAIEDPLNRLFVAEPGQPNRVPGLEMPTLMRGFGLILENVDGLEDPTQKFAMRGVPHSLSMATSLMPPPPDPDGTLPDGTTEDFLERTGWSGDGVFPPGTLRLFSAGATIQHFTTDLSRVPGTHFVLPTDAELDAMEAYMLATGRVNELDLAVVSLTDSDAEAGRVLFNLDVGGGKCFGCHVNGSANFVFAGNRNFDTATERVRNAQLNQLGIPFDGGFGGQGLPNFNFDADGDGIPDAFGNGGFNTPPLVEAADTGPFFHTNASATIEASIEFYSTAEFNESPAGLLIQGLFGEGIDLDADQNARIGKFLRVINASFNLKMAVQRLEAARAIAASFGPQADDLVDELLALANAEQEDAYTVLSEVGLHPSEQARILSAIHDTAIAAAVSDVSRLTSAIDRAILLTSEADAALGTGLDFELGEGNLAF